jgi:hypothetical protein
MNRTERHGAQPIHPISSPPKSEPRVVVIFCTLFVVELASLGIPELETDPDGLQEVVGDKATALK